MAQELRVQLKEEKKPLLKAVLLARLTMFPIFLLILEFSNGAVLASVTMKPSSSPSP